MTGDPLDPGALGAGVAADGQLMSGHAALPLEATGPLLGAYRWVERRLFQVVGGWVTSETVPAARVLYDVQSRQHAWHAELWEDRLPVLDNVDPDALTAPPSSAVDRLLTTLAGGPLGGIGNRDPQSVIVHTGGTLLRLVGLGRVVLPRLVVSYSIHLRRCAAIADASVARALRLVLRDEVEEWREVEALLQSLVHRASDLAVMSGHHQALESMVLSGGPGLLPWPGSEAATERVGNDHVAPAP
jgi:hypothetical protein